MIYPQPEDAVLEEQQRETALAQPFVYEDTEGNVSLYFRIGEVQSLMSAEAPDDLLLPYTRTMMAFLLFNEEPRSIVMIGLGGGSMAKWCYRQLPETDISVVEINPQVIEFREHFHIPEDDERFRIVCADGASYVAETFDRPDVLMVDGFGPDGQPPELCSESFYADCYRTLDREGLLVVNLCDQQDSVQIARIRRSFGEHVLVATFDDGDNKIVFAGKGKIPWPEDCAEERSAAALVEKLEALSTRWGQPACEDNHDRPEQI